MTEAGPRPQPEPLLEAAHPGGAPRRRAASFVVRLWQGPHPGDAARPWRGQIVHIQSGATSSFADAATMLAFMAEHGVEPGDPVTTPQEGPS